MSYNPPPPPPPFCVWNVTEATRGGPPPPFTSVVILWWEVGNHHQTALSLALPGPFGEQHLHWVANGRLIRPPGCHGHNHRPAIPQERDVPQHVMPVLRSDPQQVLSVAAGLLRTMDRASIVGPPDQRTCSDKRHGDCDQPGGDRATTLFHDARAALVQRNIES